MHPLCSGEGLRTTGQGLQLTTQHVAVHPPAPNQSAKDAIRHILHATLSHLDRTESYVLFIDRRSFVQRRTPLQTHREAQGHFTPRRSFGSLTSVWMQPRSFRSLRLMSWLLLRPSVARHHPAGPCRSSPGPASSQKAFAVHLPKLWNALPGCLRRANLLSLYLKFLFIILL